MTEGIVYMAFGDAAIAELAKSIESLRRFADYPVLAVADKEVGIVPTVIWKGEYPYNPEAMKQHKFMAGRVKPFLCAISPFDKTLYLDCDTEFMQSPEEGFALLDRWDMAVAKHAGQERTITALKFGLEEKEAMIQCLSGNSDVPYLNSGVIFFRKCPQVESVFQDWYTHWMEWGHWDEQQALMKAIYTNPLRMLVLNEGWNHPKRELAKVIYHAYGKGAARTDVVQ